MRDHVPESTQRGRRNRDAELAEIALQEIADVVLAPREADRARFRNVRPGETATQPEGPEALGSNLGKVESPDVDVVNTACETLGHVPDEARIRAAEDEKTRRSARAVGKDAQD